MAGAIDFENVQLILKNRTLSGPLKRANDVFYIGEVVHLQLRCKISGETLNKFKTPYPPRSPVSLNVLANLKRQLASSFEVKCSVRGVNRRILPEQEDKQGSDFVHCKVTNCCLEDCQKCLTTEAFLSEDRHYYHIPLEVRIPDIPSSCKKAEIYVHVRPSSKLGPCWLSSPTKPESPCFDHIDDMDSSTALAGKIVSQIVRIVHLPKVSVQQLHVGNQEMMFVKVKNSSTYSVKVMACSVQPESCPKSSIGSQFCSNHTETRNVCVFHASMVKMITTDDSLLPIVLRPGECFCLCYILNLVQFEASFAKDDVTLEARIKWNIHITNDEDGGWITSPVITVYRLHGLKLRKGLFVVSAACDNAPIKKGQSFTVTYTIHNRLQDFLSIKLHWSPVLPDDSCESVRQFVKLQAGLICHDPSVQLGSCQYGDTVQAKVTFCATSKGLFEVCKHMKINLRYLIPGSDNNSLASPTSQCSAISEDHLSVVPDQIWRTRSGSGSSLSSPRHLSDGKMMTSANKSYSFDDLGPNNDRDAELFKKPGSDKTPVLPRRDPKLNVMSASKYEQMLLSPGNFIKNTCLIMVE